MSSPVIPMPHNPEVGEVPHVTPPGPEMQHRSTGQVRRVATVVSFVVLSPLLMAADCSGEPVAPTRRVNHDPVGQIGDVLEHYKEKAGGAADKIAREAGEAKEGLRRQREQVRPPAPPRQSQPQEDAEARQEDAAMRAANCKAALKSGNPFGQAVWCPPTK